MTLPPPGCVNPKSKSKAQWRPPCRVGPSINNTGKKPPLFRRVCAGKPSGHPAPRSFEFLCGTPGVTLPATHRPPFLDGWPAWALGHNGAIRSAPDPPQVRALKRPAERRRAASPAVPIVPGADCKRFVKRGETLSRNGPLDGSLTNSRAQPCPPAGSNFGPADFSPPVSPRTGLYIDT